jgi:hypothetical protein
MATHRRTALQQSRGTIYCPAEPVWDPVELYFCAGDSNAVGQDSGYTPNYETVDAPDPRIEEYSQGNARSFEVPPAGELFMLQDPAQQDTVGGGIGPISSFLRRRLEIYPGIQKIYLAGLAVGGSLLSIEGGWKRGDTLWSRLVTALKDIQRQHPEAVPKGGLFSMGRRDAANTVYDPAQMRRDFLESIQGIRENILGGERMVVAVPTMPGDSLGDARVAAVDAQIRVMPEFDPRVAVVSMSDYGTYDGQHFETDSYRYMGIQGMNQLAAKGV